MCSCAKWLVRNLLFLFNLLCALAGLAIIIIGIVVLVGLKSVTSLLPGSLIVAPILCIVVGVIIFVVSFLGCCGAKKENSCMLTTYAIFLIVLVILEIVVAVFAFRLLTSGHDAVENSIMNQYMKYDTHVTTRNAIDGMQSVFKCCGTKDGGGRSSFPNTYFQPPKSCCSESKQCEWNETYQKGCVSYLLDFFDTTGRVIGGVTIIVAAVMIAGIVFSCCLCCSKK